MKSIMSFQNKSIYKQQEKWIKCAILELSLIANLVVNAFKRVFSKSQSGIRNLLV